MNQASQMNPSPGATLHASADAAASLVEVAALTA
jgi:hypothetical protein